MNTSLVIVSSALAGKAATKLDLLRRLKSCHTISSRIDTIAFVCNNAGFHGFGKPVCTLVTRGTIPLLYVVRKDTVSLPQLNSGQFIKFFMSSLTRHVAEQPDILAADAKWRKELTDIVEELSENFPGIRRSLRRSTGCDEDAVVLFDASNKLMKLLHQLEERQQAAVASLEKHQAAWSAAIVARDGKLGELDAQLIGLTAEIRESECTARNTREQNQQAERRLALLTEQLSSAETNLRISQATETMIKQSHVTERERIHELESRLNKRKDDLDKQEKKQDARFSTLDAQERGKTEELTRRERELETREEELTRRERELETREEELTRRERELDTLVHDKATETSLNKESLRNALQGVKDLHAINDTLNTNLLASSERLKTAAGTADALRSEMVGLKSQIANIGISLSDCTTECLGLKAAAEETKATVASLESQCSEKNAIITNLDDEAKLAAACAAQKIADLEADVGDRNSQIQALDQRHRTLQSELESELGARDSHIQLLNQDRQSLETEKEEMSTHIAGLQEKLKKLRQDMIALSKAKYSKAAEKNHGLAEEIERVKERVELLNRQLATVTESLQVARASNESLTKQADEDQKERNRLQAEIQSLRVVTLPEKEGLIKKLISEAAEQKRQASASQSNLIRQISDIQKQVSELQDKIVEQDAELRELEGDYARLQTAAEDRSIEAESAQTKLTEAQATIESLDNENVQHLRRNADLTAAFERCTLEHSDLDRVVEELDRLGKENAEVTSHRDTLLHAVDGTKAELERLTARLRSCHCSDSGSSRKRPHDQVDPEEEGVSSPDRPRRLDKVPESVVGATTTGTGPSALGNPPDESLSPRTPGSTGQGTATGSNSEGPVEQPLVLRHGTKWRIDDVLNPQATAHPIPQAILIELRRKIGLWERQRANWRAGSSDWLPKCAERYALKRGTQWVDGDSHRACSHCTTRKQLCAALTPHHIELLPANGDSNSGLGVADSRYWVDS